jgi:hypothetical protein
MASTVTRGSQMTDINTSSSKPIQQPSINDNLPTSNPPLKVVFAVLGCLVLVALVLTFHSSLGF